MKICDLVHLAGQLMVRFILIDLGDEALFIISLALFPRVADSGYWLVQIEESTLSGERFLHDFICGHLLVCQVSPSTP